VRLLKPWGIEAAEYLSNIVPFWYLKEIKQSLAALFCRRGANLSAGHQILSLIIPSPALGFSFLYSVEHQNPLAQASLQPEHPYLPHFQPVLIHG
jgi:hypothetical protein